MASCRQGARIGAAAARNGADSGCGGARLKGLGVLMHKETTRLCIYRGEPRRFDHVATASGASDSLEPSTCGAEVKLTRPRVDSEADRAGAILSDQGKIGHEGLTGGTGSSGEEERKGKLTSGAMLLVRESWRLMG